MLQVPQCVVLLRGVSESGLEETQEDRLRKQKPVFANEAEAMREW